MYNIWLVLLVGYNLEDYYIIRNLKNAHIMFKLIMNNGYEKFFRVI